MPYTSIDVIISTESGSSSQCIGCRCCESHSSQEGDDQGGPDQHSVVDGVKTLLRCAAIKGVLILLRWNADDPLYLVIAGSLHVRE